MRYNSFLADADWESVLAKSHLSNPYTEHEIHQEHHQSMNRDRYKSRKLSQELTQDLRIVNPELMANVEEKFDYHEARQRAMNAMKTCFVKQRNNGHLTDDAVLVLKQAVDSVQSDHKSTQLVSSTMLKRNWKLYGIWPKLKSLIEKQLYGKSKAEVRNPYKNKLRRKLFKISFSDGFETLMQSIILLNVVHIFVEYQLMAEGEYIDHVDNVDVHKHIVQFPTSDMDRHPIYLEYQTRCAASNYCIQTIMDALNYTFIVLYIFEVVFKMSAQGIKLYMKYAWHIFDLIIVVISVIETIAVYVIESYVGAQKAQSGGDATVFLKALKFAKMIKSVRIFRLARLLRFTKTLVPVALTYLNNRLSYKIRSGYNIGQGFVRATEELETSLDLIAGEKGVSKEQMRRVLYKTKASINRDLGLLQRDYPEIAVAVKTKTAIRNLINVMHTSIRRLQDSGILDDFEVRILHDQVNNLIKQLWLLPIEMDTPEPESLFRNIHWVGDDKRLAQWLMKNSNICHFDLNEMIIQDDEEPDSIYLITKGLVKIVHGNYRHKKITDDSDEEEDSDDETEDSRYYCDYASTGIVVGEMGALLGENSRTSVVCETAVETYQIPVDVIHEAYEKFPKLLDTLWSVVGMKVAIPLMLKESRYQGSTQDELRRILASSYITNFSAGSHFEVTKDMTEVILLNGLIVNEGEYTDAPALIKKHDTEIDSETIYFQENSVILIVKKSAQGVGKKRQGSLQ